MAKTAVSVLVYGTGSIGAVCVFLLSKDVSTKRIFAVCRSNYEAARSKGFTINSDIWGNNHVVRPVVVKSVDEALALQSGFDYVFITTKAMPLEDDAKHPISAAVSPHTAIVVVQNGIAIEEPFHRMFPQNPIISVVMYTPLTQTEPSVFSHQLLDKIILGTFPSCAPIWHKEAAEVLRQLLVAGGASVTHDDDIQYERWKKLLINASENPICALSNVRDVQFLRSAQGATQFMRDVMCEVAATARAAGYRTIDDSVVQSQLEIISGRKFPGVEPSMMADAVAKRTMESDAILGNALKIAQIHKVPTPMLTTLFYLINGLNCSFFPPKN